jgi:alkanesulfonate monooxygenase SsuD/methylene tetrahydromethanopterin reductase-like flavin-dependent oxidoreductase (luciferase family)
MSLTVAARTTTQKLGASVRVAPYRNPLCDACQSATVDQLSNGRLLFGVRRGWLQEENPILRLDYKDRGKRTEECIEVYTRAWPDDVVFH